MKTINLTFRTLLLFFVINITFGQNKPQNEELLDYISKSDHHKVDSLLSKGCDPNFQETPNSSTPAMIAVYESDLEMLQLLEKYGANLKSIGLLEITRNSHSEFYKNVIQTAIGEGKIRILKYLADTSKSNIPVSEIFNISSLKIAIQNGRKNVFNFLEENMTLNLNNYHELFYEALRSEKLDLSYQILPKIVFFSNEQKSLYTTLIIDSKQRYFEDDSVKIKLLKGIGVDSSYKFDKNLNEFFKKRLLESKQFLILAYFEKNQSVKLNYINSYRNSLKYNFRNIESDKILSSETKQKKLDSLINIEPDLFAKSRYEHLKGRLYYESNDLYNSEKAFENSLKYLEHAELKNQTDYLETKTEMSYTFYKMGKYEIMKSTLDSVKNYSDIVFGLNSNENITINDTYSIYYGTVGDNNISRDYGEKALIEALEQNGETLQYAINLINISYVYNDLGEYTKSKEKLILAKKLCEKFKDDYHVFSSLKQLADTEVYLGNYSNALNNIDSAISFYLEKFKKPSRAIMNAFGSKSRIYYELGDWPNTEKILMQIFDYIKSTNYSHPLNDIFSFNLSKLYFDMGNYEEAEKYIKETILTHEKYNKTPNNNTLSFYDLESKIQFKLGNKEVAKKQFIRNRELAYKIFKDKAHLEYAIFETGLSEYLILIGDTINAGASIENALKILKESNSLSTNTYKTAILYKGNLMLLKKNLSSLKEFLRYSDSLFNQGSINPKTKLNFLILKQKILNELKEDKNTNLSELNITFKKYLLYNSAILTQNQYLNFIKSLESQYYFLLSENIKNKRFSELFDLSTLLKKRFLSKYLEITSGNLNESSSVTLKKIIAFRKYLNSENYQNNKADSLFKEILLEIPNNDSLPLNSKNFSGIDIMKVTINSQNKYYANIKDGNTFTLKFLCYEEELKKIQTNFFENDKWNPNLNETLLKYFYTPLKKYFNTNIKYISMDGLFNFLPISGIRVSKNKYLIDNTGFVYLSILNKSENFIIAEKKDAFHIYYGINYFNKTNSNNSTELSFNNLKQTREVYKNIWPKLPNSLYEGSSIIKTLNSAGFKTDSLCCNNASEENVKNKLKDSPEFLHFATHGFYFGKNSGDSSILAINRKKEGLVFAGANNLGWEFGNEITPNDGILSSKEIANLNLQNTKLVVLSACQTALGEEKGSEGVFGLQRAFKMAGVEYIIASLWKVPDAETAEMMIYFYENLAKSESIEVAFRNAQLKMRKKYPPYYWAGFVLTK